MCFTRGSPRVQSIPPQKSNDDEVLGFRIQQIVNCGDGKQEMSSKGTINRIKSS